MKKITKIELEKFSRKFGKLLSTGVPLLKSLGIIGKEQKNKSFSKVINEISEDLRNGKRFSFGLKRYPGIFSEAYIAMVVAGENGGILDKRMNEIADAISDGVIDVVSGAYTRDSKADEEDNWNVIKFVNEIISKAVELNANDFQILPNKDSVIIRIRKDKKTVFEDTLDKTSYVKVITRIKFMSALDVAERRLPQDGRIRIKVQGKSFDLLVKIIPSIFGEACFTRILANEIMIHSADKVFSEKEDLAYFNNLIDNKNGLVYFVGPTGSGKTSTLLAAIDALNDGNRSIISIEEPVEVVMENIMQIQVRNDIGLTFPASVRTALKFGPDVMMIGDVKDPKTMNLVMKQATEDLLVLMQYGAEDILSFFEQVLEFDISPVLFATALRGVTFQKLVRKNCPKCSKSKKVTASILKYSSLASHSIKQASEGKGCKYCNDSGYVGRLAIYEFLIPNKEFRDALIAKNFKEIEKLIEKQKHNTLEEQLAKLVKDGKTSIAEAERVLHS